MRQLQRMADGLRCSVIELLERLDREPHWAIYGAMAAATDEAFELAPQVWHAWPLNTQ